MTLLLANLDVVGRLIIQSAAMVSAAFAVPVLFFMLNEKVGGYFMAFLMVAGIVATAAARASGFLSGGQEFLAGLTASLIIISARHFMIRTRA